MTQDEIIEMAIEAGFFSDDASCQRYELKAFAKLVAAKEREACANVAENMDAMILALLNETRQPIAIAARIRARGQE